MIMTSNDAVTIYIKTENVLLNAIDAINQVLDYATLPPFKMLLIDSRETLKERCETLQEKQAALQNVLPSTSSAPKDPTDSSPLIHSDKQIAHNLFDCCNTSVKKIYTYLNEYKGIDKKVEKLIKEAVKAIERLREHLAEYL